MDRMIDGRFSKEALDERERSRQATAAWCRLLGQAAAQVTLWRRRAIAAALLFLFVSIGATAAALVDADRDGELALARGERDAAYARQSALEYRAARAEYLWSVVVSRLDTICDEGVR